MEKPFLTKRLAGVHRWFPLLTAGVLLAAGYPVFLRPWMQSAEASSRGEAFGELYAERLASMERVSQRLNEQVRRLQKWKEEEGMCVFTPEEAEAFFARLEPGAAQARCRVAAVEYDLVPAGKGVLPEESRAVELRAVKLQMYGSYDGWIQWIRQMESLPQCVLVDSLKIESARDRAGVLAGRVCLLVPIVREPERQNLTAEQKSEEN